MSEPGRSRVSIPSVPLAIQPRAVDIASFRPAESGESVTEIAASAEDRLNLRRQFEVIVDGWRFVADVEPAARAELRDRAARAAAEHQDTVGITLRAQIPGRVVRLWVVEGQSVDQNERLLAIEAMKMENEIRAPRAGVVDGIRVEVGDRVEREDELLNIG